MPLEHAVCCAQLGKYEEAIRAYDKILGCSSVPESVRELAARNREVSVANMDAVQTGS